MALESMPHFAPRPASVKYFARQICKDHDLLYGYPFGDIETLVQPFDIVIRRIFLLEIIRTEYFPQFPNHQPLDHSYNPFWASGDIDLDPFIGLNASGFCGLPRTVNVYLKCSTDCL